jgi:hypothetical protein
VSIARRPTFYVPGGELTPELLRNVLSLVSVTVPLERIERWVPFERLLAYDWAIREHLRASDNPVHSRPRPSLLDP